MIFVPQSRILPRALWRPAIFFFAVAQFFLAFAPLMEGRFGADARAHVELAGTSTHHAHNDADCAACTARGLLASANIATPAAFESPRADVLAPSQQDVHLASRRESSSKARAPPFRTA